MWWVLGNRYTLLLTSEDSSDAFSLIKIVVPAGRGSSLHTHAHEDETFYVVEGEVEFSTGGQGTHAGLGSVIFGPRRVSHSFRNVGTGDACMLCTITPGGLERLFTDVGMPAWDRGLLPPEATPEDIERLRWAALKYGIEMHDPDEGCELATPVLPSAIPSQMGSLEGVRHLT